MTRSLSSLPKPLGRLGPSDVPHQANQALEAPHLLALSAAQATIFAATGGLRPRSQFEAPAALPPLLPYLNSKPSQPPTSFFDSSPDTHLPLTGGAFGDNSQVISQSSTLSTLGFFYACIVVPLPHEHRFHSLSTEHPLARFISDAHWFPSTHAMQQFSHTLLIISKYPFVPVAPTLVYAPFDTGGGVPPGQHAEAQLIPLLRVHTYPQLLPSTPHIALWKPRNPFLDKL
ncbi:hypothetical protein L7F22_059824 [Adiantum nelumboides]|nr:hypothetical protein [Adiantum nelumboides]